MPDIRPYQNADRSAVAQICLKTGDSGRDATGLYSSDELLADIFVLPYVDFEPELAWVVDAGDHVAGYIVGTADTRAFAARYRDEWLPWFASKHHVEDAADDRDARMIATGLNPEKMVVADVDAFPAHLHIDLLPELQGQGFGRSLIRTLLAALAERGVPALHLGVAPDNAPAQGFYRKLGFVPLPSDTDGSLLGISTHASV